ncbi:hypothetical protein LY78DRAFT_471823 [Colletotrichum sublineola]|nr:hypothetical protein LY78DRAFT_471823 [Colletotrichum sublineola]
MTKFACKAFETPTSLRKIMVVLRALAVIPSQVNGKPLAIYADHINMVKFASREDLSYLKVLEVL